MVVSPPGCRSSMTTWASSRCGCLSLPFDSLRCEDGMALCAVEAAFGSILLQNDLAADAGRVLVWWASLVGPARPQEAWWLVCAKCCSERSTRSCS